MSRNKLLHALLLVAFVGASLAVSGCAVSDASPSCLSGDNVNLQDDQSHERHHTGIESQVADY